MFFERMPANRLAAVPPGGGRRCGRGGRRGRRLLLRRGCRRRGGWGARRRRRRCLRLFAVAHRDVLRKDAGEQASRRSTRRPLSSYYGRWATVPGLAVLAASATKRAGLLQ